MSIARSPLLITYVIAACGGDSTPVVGGPGGGSSNATELVLAVGEEAQIDALLVVGVSGVPADSRCPLQAMCVWAGEAAVAIHHSLGSGPSTLDTLYTTPGRNAVGFGGYRITLLDLTPYPVQPGGIPPDAYAAQLRVEQLPEQALGRSPTRPVL